MDAFVGESSEMGELRGLVDQALAGLLPRDDQPPHRVHAAMRYAVLTPGKRIRPILALLSARQLGCDLAVAMPAACALEFVHAASLVLDDLPCMDDAAERRGRPSVHARFGQNIAVLSGVALLNEAFATVSRTGHYSDAARVAMASLLAATVGSQGLIGGQDLDLAGETPTLGSLTEMHRGKTGALFRASVEMGALAAGAEPSVRALLGDFGLELGLAFQAFDDLDDEEDLVKGRGAANLLSLMDRDELKREADHRLDRAKAALAKQAPQMSAISRYVDALLDRAPA